MSEKIKSFEDWQKQPRTIRSLSTMEEAWNACAKMKDEENDGIRKQLLAQCKISHELMDEKEKLQKELKDARSAYDHLSSEYKNLDKSWVDYKKENEELKERIFELTEGR